MTTITTTTPTEVVVVTSTPPQVVEVSTTTGVTVEELGIRGIQGIPGPGPVVLTYDLVAASSWFQVHSFGYPPNVRLVNSSGEQVYLGVDYPDSTHVALSFPAPFTGTVVLS